MIEYMSMVINKVYTANDIMNCQDIRRVVFIEGQNISVEDEIDGRDAESEHYLLKVNEVAAGTARVRYTDEKAKIERVAILPTYQGQGLGKDLMYYIIDDIKLSNRCKKVVLGAQTYIIKFYENLGFNICSQEYMDAGIPHKDMELLLHNI